MLQEVPVSNLYPILSIIEDLKNSTVLSNSDKFLAKPIIGVEKWTKDEYYLGELAHDLYPFWREVIIEFEEEEKNELIITGAIGSGKSLCALVIFLRKLYILSCHKPVARYLGLAGSSLVLFVYLALSVRQANLTGYGKLLKLVDSIPYFKAEFSRNPQINSVIDFKKEVAIIPGSDISHYRGGDLFGLIFDEGNFRRGTDKAKLDKALEIYNESTNRRRSRFLEGEDDKSFSIIVSSTDSSLSFTEERIRDSVDDPSVMVVRATTWQTKPAKYSGRKFWVFKGTDLIDPFIDEDKNALSAYFSITNQEEKPIEKLSAAQRSNWIQVPVEYLPQFRSDIGRALADIAGVAVGKSERIMTNEEAFATAFPKDGKLYHPFTKDRFVISYQTDERVEDYLMDGFYFDPKKYYNIHIDQCIPGHVRVTTDHGLIPIQELYRMDVSKMKVWTGVGWASFEVLDKGKSQLISVEFKDGRVLDCDVNHKVLYHTKTVREEVSSNFGTKELKGLAPLRSVCSSKVGEYEFKEEEITDWEYCGERTHNFIIKKEDVNEMFYWMGYLIGDGYTHGSTIGFCFGNCEQEKAEKLIKFLEKIGLESIKIFRRKKEGYGDVLTVSLRSVGLIKYFKEFMGYNCKGAHDKRVPKRLWRSRLKYRKSFLDGLWDADGTKSTGSLHLCNSELLREVQLLAFYTGRYYKLTKGKFVDKRAGTLSYWLTQRPNDGTYKGKRGKYLHPDYFYANVKNIEIKEEVGRVYTLSVDDPMHVFDAETIISKNSLAVDSTGLAISHKDVDKEIGEYVQIDLMVKIDPPPRPDQISVRKIQEFIVYLRDRRGLNIQTLSYDQYQSASAIQEAINSGINAVRLSVDKDASQYDLLVDLILRGNIRGYFYAPFKEELFFLEKDRIRRKVDHVRGRGKDCSDGVAGSVWHSWVNGKVPFDWVTFLG